MARLTTDGFILLNNGKLIGMDDPITPRDLCEISLLLCPRGGGFPYGGGRGGQGVPGPAGSSGATGPRGATGPAGGVV